MMTMSGIGFDYGCESYDEHGKPEQLDASAEAFGAVVRVAGLAVRDDLARPFLLTRNTGTALGVHTPRVQTLQVQFILNADEVTTCLREKNAELSDACGTAIEAEMKQIPGASDRTGAHERIAG
jgi:hypothetical protein